MASSATLIFTGQKLEPYMNPDQARTIAVALIPSTNFAKGTVLGELTATPGTYGPYASGNSDGTQTPKVILAFDCQTDASGNITLSPTGAQVGGPFNEQFLTVEAYYKGAFNVADLTGLDANAVTKLGGHMVSGVVAGPGVVEIG